MISRNILDYKSPQSDVCVLSYNLQEQMYISALVYTRFIIIYMYESGIHLEDEGKHFMNIWNETAGK